MSEPPLPSVDDLRIDTIRGFRDPRGVLFPAELPALAGFAPLRLFWISEVPADTVRGGHAHRACSQYLICCTGRVGVAAFDGNDERHLPLLPGQGVLLPPGIYASQIFEAPGSLLLVLCDQPYDPADYLHSREEFAAYRGTRRRGSHYSPPGAARA